MAITLAINSGSATKQYALFNTRTPVLQMRFEKTTNGFEVCTHAGDGIQERTTISEDQYTTSLEQVTSNIKTYLETEKTTLDTIAVRVVAPGKEFQDHRELDDLFLSQLRRHELSAPLHIPVTIQEIKKLKKAFPDSRMFAVSDSAFHRTLPERARNFSIDRSDAETYDIYRFGYHGLSVASVMRRIHPVSGDNPKRVVVCHVGGGVSVTAVLDGVSVDTSMGYSEASGLPMGSRVGDIDPSALLQLMRAKNLKPVEAEMYIHTKGGLFGLTETADIRHIFDRRAKGDAIAAQSLELFLYHIQKSIAASTVALGGLDMLVLTGTACTRSSELRQLIVAGIGHLGVLIDSERNDVLVGQDGICSQKDSPAKVVTIRTDELGEMVRVVDVARLSEK